MRGSFAPATKYSCPLLTAYLVGKGFSLLQASLPSTSALACQTAWLHSRIYKAQLYLQITDLDQMAASNMLICLDARFQRKLSDCAIRTLAIGLVQLRIDSAKVTVVPMVSAQNLALSEILNLNALTLWNSGKE